MRFDLICKFIINVVVIQRTLLHVAEHCIYMDGVGLKNCNRYMSYKFI